MARLPMVEKVTGARGKGIGHTRCRTPRTFEVPGGDSNGGDGGTVGGVSGAGVQPGVQPGVQGGVGAGGEGSECRALEALSADVSSVLSGSGTSCSAARTKS